MSDPTHTETIRAFEAGEIDRASARKKLIELGFQADEANEFLYIASGGDDVIEISQDDEQE